MDDDPHFISPAERAEGEPGEHGCLHAEAEEREAEESAPEILESFRAITNPPPDQPYPSPAFMDMMVRREDPRAHLGAHFNQALRRGEWAAFGFLEDQGRRVPVRSPWRDGLTYDDQGGMANGNRRTHVEVLFYRVGAKTPALSAGAPEQDEPDKDQPRDTAALRSRAKTWLAGFVAREHVSRDDTLGKMRAEYAGLSIRGSKKVFQDYSAAHPELKLSSPGRKSKRYANNRNT